MRTRRTIASSALISAHIDERRFICGEILYKQQIDQLIIAVDTSGSLCIADASARVAQSVSQNGGVTALAVSDNGKSLATVCASGALAIRINEKE